MKNILLVLFLLVSTNVYSHSGGTDSNGCHAGSQPYHCHNDGDSSSADLDGLGTVVGVLVVGWLMWEYCLPDEDYKYGLSDEYPNKKQMHPVISLVTNEDESEFFLGIKYEF